MTFPHPPFSSAAAAVAVAFTGTAFGPLLLRRRYDQLSSYDPAIPVLMDILVIDAILITTLGHYTHPAVNGFDQPAAAEVLSDIAGSGSSGRPMAEVRD